MIRRSFLKLSAATALLTMTLNNASLLKSQEKTSEKSRSEELFDAIMKKAKDNNWDKLAIGEIIGAVAVEFIDTPYLGGTLDLNPKEEKCVVNLEGLDCVTFFENSLCIARLIKKGLISFDDFINELTLVRYRKGNLTDYTSRLHYTSDWIYDNSRKGIVRDITKNLGGVPKKFSCSFMSKNPDLYPGLRANKELIKEITKIEKDINDRTYCFIPKQNLKDTQKKTRKWGHYCHCNQ